jgi:hypothetical protein
MRERMIGEKRVRGDVFRRNTVNRKGKKKREKSERQGGRE